MKKIISTIALLAASPLLTACGNSGLPPIGGAGTGGILDGVTIPGCELSCRTLDEAGAGISGIVEVDAFFSAVLNFEAQANGLEADIRGELVGIAKILELDVEANATVEQLSTAIAAEINGGFAAGGDAVIDGEVSLSFEPPRCEVTAMATIEASAKCDVSVKEGSVAVACKGECVADANVMASCMGEAELKCQGTAPSFDCQGECKGTCELDVAAECQGECTGTCEVEAAVDCDGEFVLSTVEGALSGTCNLRAGASCNGMCKGSCELSAGGDCSGSCKGECTYTPPDGGCTGGAKASCEASADASVMCEGECKGEVTPPEVKGSCEATAKAEADFKAECAPPSVGLSYELTSSASASFMGDLEAKAAFEAKLQAFATAYGRLVTKDAKLQLVLNAGAGLAEAGGNAVLGAAEDVAANTSVSLSAVKGATCAITVLGEVGGTIDAGVESLTASANAIAGVSGAIGG